MKQNIQTAALIAVSLMSVGSKKAEADRIQYNIDDALAASTDDNNKMSWVFSQHVKRDPATLTAATPEEKFDADGYNSAGYDRDGYDRDGFDREGFDREGFDRDGWNVAGINKITQTQYDNEGYDKNGYNEEGLNRRGFASNGCYGRTGWCYRDVEHVEYGVDLYDPEGYDAWGYDENGYDKDGNPSGEVWAQGNCRADNLAGCQWWPPHSFPGLNEEGNHQITVGHWGQIGGCFSADTPITLADGTIKRADEIGYDDELLVWNFDEGKFDKAKPLWLKVPQITDKYNYLRFSDGSIFKTIDQHRIFNREAGKFTYPMTDETPLGTHTLNAKGEWVELVEKRVVHEEVVYYNIITDFHINCFAGNVLASCRFNNLYPIKDLKFVKDNRAPVPYEEYAELDKKWYDGLRLSEQPREVNKGNDVHHARSVVEHIQNVYIKNAQS